MNKKTKVVSVVIILVVCMVLLAACGGGNDDLIAYFTDGDFEYSILKSADGDHAVISLYAGTEFSDTVVVRRVETPSSVTYEGKEYAVKAIGNLAFNVKNVEPVIVGAGVEKIGAFTFAECGATFISLPSSVAEIGDYAFANCPDIRTIALNASVPPKLGAYAFKNYVVDGKKYVVNANLRIEVPIESLETYKSAANWSEYKSILKGV